MYKFGKIIASTYLARFCRLTRAGAMALAFAPLALGAPGDTTLISQSRSSSTGAQASNNAVISPDGRYAVFMSTAPNLVDDDTNLSVDVFVVDLINGSIKKVELPPLCEHLLYRVLQDAAFSTTGRYIAISYDEFCLEMESDVGAIVRYDQQSGASIPLLGLLSGTLIAAELAISADGRYVAGSRSDIEEGGAYPGFVRDVSTGLTDEIASFEGGVDDGIRNVSMSSDAGLIVFQSDATNLVADDTNNASDVFQYVRSTGNISRISKSTSGIQGNAASYDPVISADGRIIAFASDATSLVAGDTNGRSDIFIRNRADSSTSLVSTNSGGVRSNGISNQPALSENGRYVAFRSFASNLVASDTNKKADVFVRDRQTNTTSRVSLGGGATQGNGASSEASISADGRFVTFGSFAANFVANDKNNDEDTFLVDRQSGSLTLLSTSLSPTAGLPALDVATSAGGRHVVFSSREHNLVAGDTNGFYDVFLRDRAGGTMTRISVSADGVQGNEDSSNATISGDGRYVAFASGATNILTDDPTGQCNILVRDRQSSSTKCGGTGHSPRISANGQFVVFQSDASNLVPNDTNSAPDIFVRNLTTGVTERVSLTPSGEQLQDVISICCGAINADGRFVTFNANAWNLYPNGDWDRGIFIRDRALGTTSQVDLSNAGESLDSGASQSAISANGRYVVFSDGAIHLRDRQLGTTTAIDTLPPGQVLPPGIELIQPAISGDGRYVSFNALFDEDFINSYHGTFVHDRQTGATQRADVSSNGSAAFAGATFATLSSDGRSVVFLSYSTNLSPEPIAGITEFVSQPFRATSTFVHELGTPTPKFAMTPSSLNFGSIAAGRTSVAKTVTVANTGTVPVGIDKIALAGADASQFRRANNCPAQLNPGAQCSVSVTFRPTSTGAKSASLKVTPTVGAPKAIALSGTGT